ncbi:MAG TPA: MMPL family transporter, partial [Acidimicrobiales bacterium]|nr:MMPL family transporter [Acidimicrobiales bacterium]
MATRADVAQTVENPAPAPGRARRRRLSRGAALVGLLGIVFLLVGMSGAQYQGKMAQVETNTDSAFLPASAQSTKVSAEAQQFQSVQAMPGSVVYQRRGGLTRADRAAITAEARAFRSIRGVVSDQVGSPQFSTDGTTAAVPVPLVSVSGDTMADVEKAVLDAARAGVPAGVAVYSAGPSGLLVALLNSFNGIDGALLFAAIGIVVLILLVVYRSPVLWVFPLLGAVVALGVASLIVYMLGKHGVLTLNGQSTGILSVLVLGAGTDYALLLTSRYREELHNYHSRLEAMTKAWRRASTTIVASGATVILALLTLSFSELNNDRSMGPVLAIGVGCTVVSMLTFLPMALTVMPRGIFWPRVPAPGEGGGPTTTGPWKSIAGLVARNDRRAWVTAVIALGICAAGITTLKAGGLSSSQEFTNNPEAVVGQDIYDAHFPQGSGSPAQITAQVAAIPQVIAAVSRVPGVATAPGSVCVEPDYAKLAALASNGPAAYSGGRGGCPSPQLQVSPVGGRLIVDATLTSSFDSDQAYATIVRIRSAVSAVPGAQALVGGQSAINYDTNQAARHDRDLIIPVILAVVLVLLMLLLRAVLAPVLLVASVALSFAATLGISAFFFNHVFGFANADPSFPLFAFVFLVAFGVDYNIFLMARVREETVSFGPRAGIQRGLAATGGVITSAGLVLAATFAVLRVIPLVQLSELGFAVALGILIDTVLVRSVLVPALAHDIGR